MVFQWLNVTILTILCSSGCVFGQTCETLTSSHCRNGGECVDTENGMECNCDSVDFTGDFCEIEVDSCPDPDPCENEGVCRDGLYTYSCDCQDGYVGETCELDLNECFTSDACVHGDCENTPGSYTCTCDAGWEGPTCNGVYYDECETEPCENDGVCTEGFNTYTCTCDPIYTGDSCEIIPNNVTHYTSQDSGCPCPDSNSTDGCACCVTSDEFIACPCDSAIDPTVCVLCSVDEDTFTDWCSNPFVYSRYADSGPRNKKKLSFFEKNWVWLTIAGVSLVAVIILALLIARVIQLQRRKRAEQRKLEEAEKEKKFKNTEYTTNGPNRTGGNTWGDWDSDALVQVG